MMNRDCVSYPEVLGSRERDGLSPQEKIFAAIAKPIPLYKITCIMKQLKIKLIIHKQIIYLDIYNNFK